MTEEQKKEDPFNFLGFGLVAYRDLMLILFMLFVVLTALMTPAMVFYSKYDAYSPTYAGYSKYSLGNLGYASTQCQISPFDLGKITMFCPYGSIKEIKYVGVNPSSIKERDVCADNADNKVCSDLIS